MILYYDLPVKSQLIFSFNINETIVEYVQKQVFALTFKYLYVLKLSQVFLMKD